MDEYILLGKWYNSDRLYNPYTKRKIKRNKRTYNKISKILEKFIKKNNKFFYIKNRINKICPLSIVSVDNGYHIYNIWNPFSGNFTNIKDTFGPLICDPDYLIHYFYINRLKYIYTHGNFNSTGYLGDAIGKYPEFNIPGRGNHPEWYLFRLPINDCYIDHECIKYVTMGPMLTQNDISNIYNLAKENNSYYHKFNQELPNIIELYDIYHKVINKCPYQIDSSVLDVLGKDYIMQMKMDYYMPFINKIINF
jgi:hypothetical protein